MSYAYVHIWEIPHNSLRCVYTDQGRGMTYPASTHSTHWTESHLSRCFMGIWKMTQDRSVQHEKGCSLSTALPTERVDSRSSSFCFIRHTALMRQRKADGSLCTHAHTRATYQKFGIDVLGDKLHEEFIKIISIWCSAASSPHLHHRSRATMQPPEKKAQQQKKDLITFISVANTLTLKLLISSLYSQIWQ